MRKPLSPLLIVLAMSILFGGCAKKLVEKNSPPPPVWKIGKLIFIHETNQSDYMIGVDTTGGDSQINIETKLTNNSTGKLPRKGDRIILKFYDGSITAYAEDDVSLAKRKKESL